MKKRLFLLIVMLFLLVSCQNNDENQETPLDEDVEEDIENNEDDQVEENDGQVEDLEEEEEPHETDIDDEAEEEDQGVEDVVSEPNDHESSSDSSEDSQTMSLSEEEAAEIIDHFQTRLFVNVDDELKVVDFNSKTEIVEYIAEYASVQLVNEFVDQYYIEEDGHLYIIPQGSPPFLNVHEPFTFEKQDEQSYLIIQENETELHGSYTLFMVIEYVSDRFVVTDYYTE